MNFWWKSQFNLIVISCPHVSYRPQRVHLIRRLSLLRTTGRIQIGSCDVKYVANVNLENDRYPVMWPPSIKRIDKIMAITEWNIVVLWIYCLLFMTVYWLRTRPRYIGLIQERQKKQVYCIKYNTKQIPKRISSFGSCTPHFCHVSPQQ